MAKVTVPKLALLWYALVTPVVIIDAIFVLQRSKSGPHPLAEVVPFNFWVLYAEYDKRYSPNDDAFVVVQSYLNLVEVTLGVLVLLLALFRSRLPAVKLSLVVSAMTIYKTVMYFAMDVVEGGKYTAHNSIPNQLMMVMVPSSFWVVIPSIIFAKCWSQLVPYPMPVKKD